jgi:hypothetical protein
MRVGECIGCTQFPCTGVNHASYLIPDIELDPSRISILLISEASPAKAEDYYYSAGQSLFQQTTVQAFQDAGAGVSSIWEILDLGVYLTSAVKCSKLAYGVQASTIETCSLILEKELALFPNVKALLLMGDVAIKSANTIARRAGHKRVIPAGSTYKIRGEAYYFRGIRSFPSYLQAGPSFYIEKSKRKMIAEDIAAALEYVSQI